MTRISATARGGDSSTAKAGASGSLEGGRSCPPRVLDCFSGLGGLSLGARLAGFQVVGGIDANPVAVQTYAKAFPGSLALLHDLLEESPRKVLGAAKLSRGDVDVLVGGPPCQPYSVNNHQRGLGDDRCRLVDSYLSFVSALRPEWLVMENVPGFASIESGRFLESLIKSLRARGYKPQRTILDARAFGVPQRRRRLVLVACAEEARAAEVIARLEARRVEEVSVGEAIGDLPSKAARNAAYLSKPSCDYQRLMRDGVRSGSKLQAHLSHQLGMVNLERIRHVPPGGNWRSIPRELLPAGMQRAKLSDHTTRYGRLNPSLPAYTLLTKCDPHWGCFVHPSENRVITAREAARLQSIPDWVELPESLSASYRLIGNAVPPLLAKGILEELFA